MTESNTQRGKSLDDFTKKTLLLFALAVQLFAMDGENRKVVFDLTTGDVMIFEKKILSGIAMHKNHYENDFKELETSVVIHGDAYKFFVDNPLDSPFKNDARLLKAYPDLKKRIASLHAIYGVEFVMCQAGMKRVNITKKDVYAYVKYAPTSTIGLIDRQNAGFAYIPVR